MSAFLVHCGQQKLFFSGIWPSDGVEFETPVVDLPDCDNHLKREEGESMIFFDAIIQKEFFSYLLEQCFLTGVLRRTSVYLNFQGVPSNLKILKKVCKNSHIFIVLVSFYP
jgi:hypothetical protein